MQKYTFLIEQQNNRQELNITLHFYTSHPAFVAS